MSQNRIIIFEAEKKHLWDDFSNSKQLLAGLSTKREAREALRRLVLSHPDVKSFTIGYQSSYGVRLAGGPIPRPVVFNEMNESNELSEVVNG